MPAQLALAWGMAQKLWIVPIPGRKKLKHIKDNLAAADIQFTDEEKQDINRRLSAIAIHGAGYSANNWVNVRKQPNS